MPSRFTKVTPANVGTLPPLLRKSLTAAVLDVSVRTVERLLADPAVDLWPVRLGHGPRASVRVSRDDLLAYAGLLAPEDKRRRDRQRGDAEWHAVTASLGLDGEVVGANVERQ